MNRAIKETFFSIFILYCEGRHFTSRRFEIAKLEKILDSQMNLKNLY